MATRCILCGELAATSKQSPCCKKCQRSAPMAVQAPGLFTTGPAAVVARSAEAEWASASEEGATP